MGITLVVRSPRAATGLLSWPAWEALRGARTVFAAGPDPGWGEVLAEAAVPVTDVSDLPVAERAGRLLEATDDGGSVAWFGSADGDPGLTEALAEHLARRAVAGEPPEVEIVTGSHDVPGSRLLDLVAVMDRLRSPGGCPWDAEQTPRTLLPYLLEEAYELIEAIELDDREHVREELGDVLLQVMFHARIAEEDAAAPFSIDDVAAGIVEKLVRRHPHVFADVSVGSADEVNRNWEAIKAEEKGREGPFEGIPAALPALARAQKMLGRARRSGLDPLASTDGGPPRRDPVVAALLEAVDRAEAAGTDAESALREELARWVVGPG